MIERSTPTSEARAFSSLLDAAHAVLPLAVCFALVALPAYWYQGAEGLAAAAAAALVCAAASGVAAMAANRLSAIRQPIGATLFATLIRMAPPLAFCVLVGLQRGPLFDAGAIWYLIGFYMIVLVSDTWHALGRLKPIAPQSRES